MYVHSNVYTFLSYLPDSFLIFRPSHFSNLQFLFRVKCMNHSIIWLISQKRYVASSLPSSRGYNTIQPAYLRCVFVWANPMYEVVVASVFLAFCRGVCFIENWFSILSKILCPVFLISNLPRGSARIVSWGLYDISHYILFWVLAMRVTYCLRLLLLLLNGH